MNRRWTYVVGHEHQHEEERQEDLSTIQHRPADAREEREGGSVSPRTMSISRRTLERTCTYPVLFGARSPDRSPAASESLSGVARPLRGRALPLPSATSLRAISLSTSRAAMRSHSYKMPSATMTKNDATKPALVRICHQSNTTQVSSICVFQIMFMLHIPPISMPPSPWSIPPCPSWSPWFILRTGKLAGLQRGDGAAGLCTEETKER